MKLNEFRILSFKSSMPSSVIVETKEKLCFLAFRVSEIFLFVFSLCRSSLLNTIIFLALVSFIVSIIGLISSIFSTTIMIVSVLFMIPLLKLSEAIGGRSII